MWAGQTISENSAHSAGMSLIFNRISTELTAKMRELDMDRTELGSLRTIILYNPGRNAGRIMQGNVHNGKL